MSHIPSTPEASPTDASMGVASSATPSSAITLLLHTPEEEWMLRLAPSAAEALASAGSNLASTLQDTLTSDAPYIYYGGYDYGTQKMWNGEASAEWTQRHTEAIARRKRGELNIPYLKQLRVELYHTASRIKVLSEQAFLARRVDEYSMKLQRAIEQPKKWIYLPAMKRAAKSGRSLTEMWKTWTLIGERRWGGGLYQFEIPPHLVEEYQQLHESFPLSTGDRYLSVWEEWNGLLWRERPHGADNGYSRAYYRQPHPDNTLPNPRVATLELMRAAKRAADA